METFFKMKTSIIGVNVCVCGYSAETGVVHSLDI